MKPDYPITRIEHYLDKITGGERVKPEYPITRIEQYLDEIVEHGGGGSVNPDDVAEIIADFMLKGARYGVSGVGQEASALTRIWDAVGMTAQVRTDGDNSAMTARGAFSMSRLTMVTLTTLRTAPRAIT